MNAGRDDGPGPELAPWVGPPRGRTAFQMCLARAVTGPERFKGGTCSFGARADATSDKTWVRFPGLSRADSSGRYAVDPHIIARPPEALANPRMLRDCGGNRA
jgi:hypothetical protein